MALIPTGRKAAQSFAEGEGTSGVEYIDDITGEVSWVGSNAGIVDGAGEGYSLDYYNVLQNVSNKQPGGVSGALSEQAAVIDPRGTMGNVLRGMSDDFFQTAIPVKDDLIKMTTYNGNAGIIDNLKKQGKAQVERSFANAGAEAGRNAERYGMQLTKEQQAAQNSALSSGKALAEVDALNRATQFQGDLNKQLVSGMGSPAGITK